MDPALKPALGNDELVRLRDVVADYDREQLIWSSGYLAGLAATPDARAIVAAPSATDDRWTIFYATETGNSRGIAAALEEKAAAAGIATDLQNLAEFKPRQLARIERAVFVVSTHGVGEPPEGTEPFFDHWFARDSMRLEQLHYSVLALGDSSYADFCEIGRRLDARLTELGASRVAERVDCDLDFDDPAADWTERIVAVAASSGPSPAPRARLRAVQAAPVVSRAHPFSAGLLTNQRITGPESTKDVRHIEIDLESAGITYSPGDSLGVIVTNPERIADSVLSSTDIDEQATVAVNGESMPIRRALERHLEITALSRPFLDALAARNAPLATILGDRSSLQRLLASHQVVDILDRYPQDWEPQALVDVLRKLPPRLYSIASSPDANPDEAHLTVAVIHYDKFGRPHWGAASSFLADGPESVPVYVEPNDNFRLPADPDTPIIMVGAGTGVAPYRAFIEHRREHGHRGDNWLIFGDRKFSSDFLYQLEWLRYRKDGLLTHLDVAFSRDNEEKVYVQHRIAEQQRRFFEWLDRGAHVYVCGDAERMAVDVHNEIVNVVARVGGHSDGDAAERVAELRAAGRYQRDVY